MSKDLGHYTPRYSGEPTHDKTYDVAKILGLHPMHAYGLISAFRARYPNEAAHGRLRGGVAQIERLALWDGEPGRLAQAFVAARIVDLNAGEYTAHDHDLYAGETHDRRMAGRARTQKWRDKGGPGPSTTGDVTVTRHGDSHGDVTVTLSSPLLPDQDPDQDPKIAKTVPAVVVHGQKRHDMFRADEQTRWPQTIGEVLDSQHPKAKRPLRDVWRERFPSFDGRGGRPTLEQAADGPFQHWTVTQPADGRRRWDWPAVAIGQFETWMARDHTGAKQDRRFDPKASGDVDIDAILSRQRPAS